jgi:methionine biosynthesis protein MetW
MNDNRNYQFGPNSVARRDEYPIIANWIPPGSSVVDLGSGDGSLLALLTKKGVEGEGVEISETGVAAAAKKHVKSRVGRIDVPLAYADHQFEYAICNVTIQMVMYPEVLMHEMQRIAKFQIWTFPNFAFLPNRLDLLLNGRMPQVMIPGYQWYSTGHIHQLSVRDFQTLAGEVGLEIVDSHHLGPQKLRLKFFNLPNWIGKRFPTWWASTAIFLTTSQSTAKVGRQK